jgi:hypothetical protein
VIKWKKAWYTIPNPRVVIINPNCLKVDKATTNFMSRLVVAHRPPKNMVREPVSNNTSLNIGVIDKEG